MALTLLAVAFVSYVLLNTQVSQPPQGQDAIWDKFIPIAQLGIALSLAYLALPSFRHMQMLSARSNDIIGRTTDERIDFAGRLFAKPHKDTEKWPELMAMVLIFYLMELRSAARAGREFEPGMPKDENDRPRLAVAPTGFAAWNVVRHRYGELIGLPCIAGYGSRKRAIKTYFTGADVAVVLAGAGLALAVHIFSLSEWILPTAPDHSLRNPLTQGIITLALLMWSCGAPVYFALQGARLSDAIEDFATAAAYQRVKAVESDEALVKAQISRAQENEPRRN